MKNREEDDFSKQILQICAAAVLIGFFNLPGIFVSNFAICCCEEDDDNDCFVINNTDGDHYYRGRRICVSPKFRSGVLAGCWRADHQFRDVVDDV